MWPSNRLIVTHKKLISISLNKTVYESSDCAGIRDLKTVSQHSTLAELGMDSMMAVEIKQSIEREFEVFLTAQEIRSLTFARLAELSVAKEGSENTSEGTFFGKEYGTLNILSIFNHLSGF
jgi:fatty acid synthase